MNKQEREELVKSFLGKTVQIKIDRPVGYIHRKENYSLTYPINYGYIPGVLGGDSEELDVYLLGVNKPVDEYTAKIIGIVYRKNDVEDKLVAAPEGMSFTKEEIEKTVHFQEQYYDSEIEMLENKMLITIEPLKPEEYYKCSNIWNMKNQPLAETWLEEIKNRNRMVFIYKINGEFIGEGALVFDTGDSDYTIPNQRVYVSRMIVKKEYRNRGIGSEILAFLIQKAIETGYTELTIGVDKNNKNALHLYRKFGFTEVLFEGADEHGEYLKLLKRI